MSKCASSTASRLLLSREQVADLCYVQVLEASDGGQAAGWPAFHKSTVHTSPLLYDLDFDGVQDLLLATYDGEILAYRDTVSLLFESVYCVRIAGVLPWLKCMRCELIFSCKAQCQKVPLATHKGEILA